jgi:sugar phosphate isomerase/epimerase
MKRREFARALAGTVVGLAASRRAGAAAAADGKIPPSVFRGVKVGVESYTFRKFDLDRMIEAMRSVGLSYLELWEGHLDPAKASEADFAAVRRKLDAAGITVGAYCVNFPKDASDDLLEKGFRGARLLGTNVMTASVQKSLVPRLDARCQKHQTYLGLHNHWFGDPWFKGVDKSQEFETPADLLGALEGRSKYLAINLDVGHFHAAGNDPVAFLRAHHDRIVSLHVKDRAGDPGHAFCRFGKGTVPLREIERLLVELHYPYVANIEYEIEEDNPTDGVRDAFDTVKRGLLEAGRG